MSLERRPQESRGSPRFCGAAIFARFHALPLKNTSAIYAALRNNRLILSRRIVRHEQSTPDYLEQKLLVLVAARVADLPHGWAGFPRKTLAERRSRRPRGALVALAVVPGSMFDRR